ncbi:MAG TPA: TolC family protein, partial [Caldimonas sp.]
PDVASAERAMAAANAQIGVAKAAYYPSIVLAPSIGFESRQLSTLIEAQSLVWSLGAAAVQPLFSGGRLGANVDFAQAGYNAAVGNYRSVVLGAMQEVEDGITSLADLERANASARTAVATARRVLDLANARYEGGATTYLDVIAGQQALLNAERLSAQLAGERLLTAVFLIKALGGDWQGPAALAAR